MPPSSPPLRLLSTTRSPVTAHLSHEPSAWEAMTSANVKEQTPNEEKAADQKLTSGGGEPVI